MKKLAVLGLMLIFGLVSLTDAKTPEQIYEKAADCVVIISGEYQLKSSPKQICIGSGIVLSSARYGFCILTAEHIINASISATERGAGPLFPFILTPYLIPPISATEHDAAPLYPSAFFAYFNDGSPPQKLELIQTGKDYDAAILKFSDSGFKPKKSATLGKSSLLKPGGAVVAIGSSELGKFWISCGRLYAKPGPTNKSIRDIFIKTWGSFPKWPTTLTTTTLLFPGFSGCPFLNDKGEVIGMAVGYFNNLIYFGLPIDDLRKEFDYVF